MSTIDSFPRQPSPEQQKITETERFILKGADLIKAGRYSEAKRYFKNPEMAKRIGAEIDPTPRCSMVQRELQPKEIAQVADEVAYNSWFKRPDKTIILSDAFRPGHQLPDRLNHEISLIYMEEWLHCLQDKTNYPLAGYHDTEIDVAAYMIKHRIPMTSTFLNRHGRHNILTPHQADIPSIGPDIRSGTPATVTRTSGTIENDWHIERYDPTSGRVILVKGRLEKGCSPELLYHVARP